MNLLGIDLSHETTDQSTPHAGPMCTRMALPLALVGALILTACGPSATPSPAPPALKALSSPAAGPVDASPKPAVPAPAKPKEIVKVRIGERPFVSSLPFTLARDEGFFAAEGLDVSFTPFATGATNAAAVMAGEVDMTSASDEATLNLVARGADIRAIYPTSIVARDGRSQAVVVRKALYDAGVRKPADLKGRSIAWIAGWSLLPFALQRSMEAAGVDTNKEVNKQTIRENPAKVAALESGAIDSAMFTEPWVTVATSRGVGVPILYINQPDNLPIATIAFRSSFMKGKREAVLAFLRAYIKATQLYYKVQADPAEKRKYSERYAKTFGLEVEDMVKMTWSELSQDGTFDRAGVEDWMNWVAENGGLQGKVTFDQWFDSSFIDELKKQGVLK